MVFLPFSLSRFRVLALKPFNVSTHQRLSNLTLLCFRAIVSECLCVTTLRGTMTPPKTPKLSGAELAAQLAGTSFAAPAPTAPAPMPPTDDPEPEQPSETDLVQERKTPAPKAAARPKGGRPAKAGSVGDALPVNVRLALDDHAELAKVAVELMTPGRPMPTVQDVVRGLVRGALKDHASLLKLVRKGGI
jgi:hypothetical protein